MEPKTCPAISMTCPKCHGERVLRATNVFVSGPSNSNTLGTRLGSSPVSPVRALVCTTCGFLELWASDLDKVIGS